MNDQEFDISNLYTSKMMIHIINKMNNVYFFDEMDKYSFRFTSILLFLDVISDVLNLYIMYKEEDIGSFVMMSLIFVVPFICKCMTKIDEQFESSIVRNIISVVNFLSLFLFEPITEGWKLSEMQIIEDEKDKEIQNEFLINSKFESIFEGILSIFITLSFYYKNRNDQPNWEIFAIFFGTSISMLSCLKNILSIEVE